MRKEKQQQPQRQRLVAFYSCFFFHLLCMYVSRITLYETWRRRLQIKETTIQIHFKCTVCGNV